MSIAEDIIYRARVNGLRDISFGGPVTIKDAATGKVLRVIEKAPGWEELTDDNNNLIMRINLRKYIKKV